MPTVAMQERPDEFSEEAPTRKDPPSGRWIVAVDRGQRQLAAAIEALEAGAEPGDVLEDLKTAHALVNGRGAT